MKRFSLFLVLALFLSWSTGCEEDAKEVSDVTLNFRGHFGESPLVMYAQEYPYYDGMTVKFQLFQFYISDVTLLREPTEGAEGVELIDIELVTFKDIQSVPSAENGLSFTVNDIPAGEYKGIRLGLGVAPDLNATNPGDYSPAHPLSDNYWSAALGYVFTKIEGNADIDGTGEFSEKLTFHIGHNDIYSEKIFAKDIMVIKGEPLSLRFDIDVKRVLASAPDNYLDFRAITQEHSNDMDIVRFISENLEQAISLE